MQLWKHSQRHQPYDCWGLNPDNIITGAPVEYTVTINGTAVPILDIWGFPIRTDRLCPRKMYRGKYIVNDTPHVTLTNVCCTIADALANALTVAQMGFAGDVMKDIAKLDKALSAACYYDSMSGASADKKY